jgi:hypothetical protein
MMRTTSPYPVYRSTRDTRNAPLWNPSSKELTNVEDDEAGRLASFRAKYGRMFDATKGGVEEESADQQEQEQDSEEMQTQTQMPPTGSLGSISSAGLESPAGLAKRPVHVKEQTFQNDEIDDGWDFGDDDANMLDLISSYGQEDIRQVDQPSKPKKK